MKHFFALLALSAPLLGAAQTVQQQAAMAANPDTGASPLRYQPMAPVGASALVTGQDDWKAVNATVGQYRRGHSDIVKWEKAQAPAQPATAPLQEPLR